MAESMTAEQFLGEQETLTLATASHDGKPHASPMFYVADGTTLYFSTPGDTQTGRNLTENPVAAAVVAHAPPGGNLSAGRSVQLRGAVERLDGDAAQRAIDLFRSRYRALTDAAHTSTYYKLTPDEVRYTHEQARSNVRTTQALGIVWTGESVKP
jgi:uncharacterized protein YhbP (UPF0306 family)